MIAVADTDILSMFGKVKSANLLKSLFPKIYVPLAVYEELLKAYSSGGPAPCVTPSMGGQFSAVVLHWIHWFEKWQAPPSFYETRIDYRDLPSIDTNPIVLYP